MGKMIEQIWTGKTRFRLRTEKVRTRELDPIRRSPYRPAAPENAANEGLTEDRTRSHVQREQTSCIKGGNHHRSLNNVTPADVYFGRDKVILREREKIKNLTIRQRRLQHLKQAA